MASWFGKRRSSEQSTNELLPVERLVFETIVAGTYHSMTLVSLSRQLRTFLDYGVGRVVDMPDWLQRELVWGHIVLRPGRYVGGEFGFATSAAPTWPTFALFADREFCGSVSFMVGQAILEIRFHFPGLARELQYPTAAAFAAQAIQPSDERSYWGLRAREAPADMKGVASEAAMIASRGSFGRDVVVPTPYGTDQDSIAGLALPSSYRTLLTWANGVRVNDLTILGAEKLVGRAFEADHEQYLQIGDDDDWLYALKAEKGSVLADDVWSFPHGSMKGRTAGLDVLGLCGKALREHIL